MIKIEVAYARAAEQRIIPIEVAEGSTIEVAIHHSGILTLFPEIDLTTQVVGIFSAPKTLSTLVKEGDRIEIYRSLVIDPKEARRIKANALKR